jgi:hypothetical protein
VVVHYQGKVEDYYLASLYYEKGRARLIGITEGREGKSLRAIDFAADT